MQYTALPVCLTEQAGERLGESNLCKTMAGAVRSITDIYSLLLLKQNYQNFCQVVRDYFFGHFFGGNRIVLSNVRCWQKEAPYEKLHGFEFQV